MEIMESALNEEELLNDKLRNVATAYFYNPYNEEERQALILFLQNNDCRELIAKCVDGDTISESFVCAVSDNHVDILQAFFDQGMNVDIKNFRGNTALIGAIANGCEESARLLLDLNANCDLQDENGDTALISASNFGHKELVQLLLNHGADIDLKNNDGDTALDLAISEEIEEMIQNHVNTSYVLK